MTDAIRLELDDVQKAELRRAVSEGQAHLGKLEFQVDRHMEPQPILPYGLLSAFSADPMKMLTAKLTDHLPDFHRIVSEAAINGTLKDYLIVGPHNAVKDTLYWQDASTAFAIIFRSASNPRYYVGHWGIATKIQQIKNSNYNYHVWFNDNPDPLDIDTRMALVYKLKGVPSGND